LIRHFARVMVVEFDPYVNENFIPTINGEGQAGAQAVQDLSIAKSYRIGIATNVNHIFIRFDCLDAFLNEERRKLDDKPIKITAVMSMPRLAFSDNMFSVMRSLLPLNIDFVKGSGVFWGQILTRLLENEIRGGCEYIITIDYDTWFARQHVHRLCQLMAENPDVDAIVPIQMKRECESAMLTIRDKDGKVVLSGLKKDFMKPLTPIASGHFGLTIFRASAFKDLKKPWFVGVPDPIGGWDEGRLDEDMYFWQNWRESGRKTMLANEVKIGHLQMMCSFPGDVENGWKPILLYMNDLEKNGPPKSCVPVVEIKK